MQSHVFLQGHHAIGYGCRVHCMYRDCRFRKFQVYEACGTTLPGKYGLHASIQLYLLKLSVCSFFRADKNKATNTRYNGKQNNL